MQKKAAVFVKLMTSRRTMSAAFLLVCTQAFSVNLSNSFEDLELKVLQSDSNDLTQLESQVSRRLQLNAYDLEAFYLLSRIKLRQFNLNPREFDSTLRLATELGAHMIQISPEDEKGYIIHSEALDASGRNVEAFGELSVLPSRGIDVTWRYFLGLARLTAETQPMETVLDYLRRAMEFPGTNRDLITPFTIASIDSAASEMDSRAVLEQWSRRYPHPLFELRRAEALLEENAFSEAAALFGAIAKKHPNMVEATINHAILSYEIFGRTEEARDAFLSLLKRNSLSPSYKSLTYNHLGKLASLEKKDPLALDFLWNAVITSENTDETAREISGWLKQAEKWSLRQTFLKKILNWGHVRGFIYADLGESYYQNKATNPDAIQAFENAVTLEPKNGDYYNALGLAYNQSGDPKLALEVFARGLKAAGNHAEMTYNAACMQTKLGAYDEAIALLNRAVNLSPKLRELARQDPDLRILRQHFSQKLGLKPASNPNPSSTSEAAH